MPARSHSVRIIGGEWRRRLIRFPAARELRPTPDRMRETLFNWLGQDLTGQTCLDLFAGSGALGFEAASRGAKQVVMVERDAQIYRALQATHTMLGADQVELARADALAFLRSDLRRYGVVFLDPPFHLDLLPRLLPLLPGRLDEGSRVYLESDRVPELPEGYELLRQSRAGRVHGLLIKWVGS
jgi:16S rRNA (guanine966-N2)-methyltransferase